jgi:hypothetical protein
MIPVVLMEILRDFTKSEQSFSAPFLKTGLILLEMRKIEHPLKSGRRYCFPNQTYRTPVAVVGPESLRPQPFFIFRELRSNGRKGQRLVGPLANTEKACPWRGFGTKSRWRLASY